MKTYIQQQLAIVDPAPADLNRTFTMQIRSDHGATKTLNMDNGLFCRIADALLEYERLKQGGAVNGLKGHPG